MKIVRLVCVLLCLLPAANTIAQVPVKHASAEVKEKQKERGDYKEFHKQILALKEFADEKKKAPKLQKDAKEPVKIVASIDSIDGGDEIKTLTGYITRQIGDNTENSYEIIFDRAARKITAVKKLGDVTEPEAAEPKEKTTAKTGEKKKPTTTKKKDEDSDDDEADEPEEKTTKTPKKGDAE